MNHPILTHSAELVKQSLLQYRDYQQDLDDSIHREWDHGARNVMAVLPTGGGKCLGIDTPVLMFNGEIKPVQDVQIGDLLMGPDSTPRKVLRLAQGKEMMYRVTPTKGDSYVVNESHVLSLKKTAERKVPKYPCQKKAGEIVNIDIKNYLNQSKTFKHVHKGWRTGVDWEHKPVSEFLPHYMLGVWLGDGTSRNASITSADPEIVDYIYSFAEEKKLNVRCEVQPNNKSSVYHLTSNHRRENTMLAALQNENLILNKHIPLKYKTGSRPQRLELLAGILDSDGYLSHGGYDVVFKNKTLTTDLAFLCRSLGFAAYITECKKTCYNNGVTGDYFRISISGDVSIIPTRLSRHQPEPRCQKKSVLVTGIKVEQLSVDDYYGFEIDGDRLFLLGDFTVTHNTVIISNIVHAHNGASAVIAHRQELVSQISMALARNGIRHRIIGPNKLIRLIVSLQMIEFGATFYDPSAKCAVAGVDTLIRREEELARWIPLVTLVIIDEGHHCLKSNKWGKAVELFPNAKGLLVTATPCRADGAGLGRHSDGIVDALVIGPTMRDLINRGYLTEYRIIAPPSDLRLDTITISNSTGDYNLDQMRKAVSGSSLVVHEGSKVVGDIVANYMKFASGKLGITFVPEVSVAQEVADQFNAAGIPAAVVSAKTPDDERARILRDFKSRRLMNLVNVDLFGEGFDLPAIEVVSMGRPTQSYSLYAQQFGRGLRLLEGKDRAIIIDHVGNVARHGLPDAPREWTLDRREKRSSGATDAIPLRICTGEDCYQPFERYLKVCPHCGTPIPPPAERAGVEWVDGDLYELDEATLAAMRGEVAQVDLTDAEYHQQLINNHCPSVGIGANLKRHREQRDAVTVLREVMAWWAGHHRAAGLVDGEIFRKFYLSFSVDWLTAQALKRDDAMALAERVSFDMGKL